MNGKCWSLSGVAGLAAFLGVQCPAAYAATAPSLGNAQSFAVLGASAVSNTGTSVVAGDLGIAPGLASSVTGFPPGIVTGGTIRAGAVMPDPLAAAAQDDASAAFDAIDQPCDTSFTAPTDLGGMTLTPGVYCFESSAGLTGTLTLNGRGDSNAVWIFKTESTLITATDSVVKVINGGDNCNVFWRIGSSATLGTRTTFVGTLIAKTSITLVTGANVSGRALALTGAVTMDTNNFFSTVCSGVRPSGAPTLGKAFSPASINAGVGNLSTLTITLSNPNSNVATLSAPLTDTLPAGVVIAPTPNAGTNCRGTGAVAATAGGSTVTLPTTRSIPAGSGATPGTCTVTVDVTAATAGSYLDTLVAGALQTSNGNNAAPAIATLTVVPPGPAGGPPTLGKAFSPGTINAGVGDVSTLTITLSNPNNGVVAALSAALIDTLPTGVVIAPTPNASTTCSGTGAVEATAGGSTVTLPMSRSIPAGSGTTPGTCTVTVDVTASRGGSFLNTLAGGALQTNHGTNAAPAIVTLTVSPPVSGPPQPAPALSGWLLIMLTALLARVGFAAMRKQAM